MSTSKQIFDDNYKDWKVGDFIIWEEDQDASPAPVQITFLDEDPYGRVFWGENSRHMTRKTNMLRVKEVKGHECEMV